MKKAQLISSLPRIAAFLLVVVVGSAIAVSPVRAAGDAIVVIVNSSNPADNLSLGELRKLFLSDRSRWDTGKAVAPVMVSAGAPERSSFLKIVCGMNDADFNKYFLQAAFTGKSATPPKEVGGSGALKSFVSASPGAIGFLKASELSSADTAVKAVKIDGFAAGEPGYKIKM
jgi:ABC-type phosphate transport system substrate-binding protein